MYSFTKGEEDDRAEGESCLTQQGEVVCGEHPGIQDRQNNSQILNSNTHQKSSF